MSSPRIVGPGQLGEVEDALAQARAVALPGDGGYQVAVRHDHPGAFAMLRTHGAPASDGGRQIVVGHRTQAAALTTAWSKQTAHLTDRMWPGPLTVILAARLDESAPAGSGDPVVQLTMPAWRPLRTLVRRTGPLAVTYLQGTDGGPVVSAEDVRARLIAADAPAADAPADATAGEVVFIVDGGPRRGPTSTVVDCTSSPPRVLHAGALPESYVEAALLMGGRRRGLFTRRTVDDRKT